MLYFFLGLEGLHVKKPSYKARRRFFFLSICFVGVLFLFVGSIFKDWLTIMNNKQMIASMTLKYEKLLAEEESLNSEVTKLHDSDYIARYARERYMYSLPGEIIIKIPDEEK